MMIDYKPVVLLPVACSSPKAQARISYLNISAIYRSLSSSAPRRSSSQFRRSDFANQPYTGSYDAGEKTSGPLADAPVYGNSRYTPRALQQHLDKYVVGQDRAIHLTPNLLKPVLIKLPERVGTKFGAADGGDGIGAEAPEDVANAPNAEADGNHAQGEALPGVWIPGQHLSNRNGRRRAHADRIVHFRA